MLIICLMGQGSCQSPRPGQRVGGLGREGSPSACPPGGNIRDPEVGRLLGSFSASTETKTAVGQGKLQA